MLHDVRYAARCLKKSPLFFIVVTVTLGLAIGATTAVFSLVDTVLLKTLPVRNPTALVAFENVGENGVWGVFSYPFFKAISTKKHAFSGLFAWTGEELNIGPRAQSSLVSVQVVSGEYFSTLGVSAHLGRSITVEDVHPAPRDVVMISYRFWERQFGRDPDVLGRSLLVEEIPKVVVGVAPQNFLGLNIGTPPELYLPMTNAIEGGPRERRSHLWLHLVGRLKAGVTLAQAQAQVESIWPQVLEETVPHDAKGERRTRFLSQQIRLRSASRGDSFFRRDVSEALLFLMAVACVFFLLACCNVAGLLLARGMAREKEMAISLGLGASRWRLIRQLLIENLMLSIPGGILGLASGHVVARLFVSLLSQRLSYLTLDLSIDHRTMLFVFVLSLVNGVAFGLLPAWRTTRASPIALLKGEVRGGERHRRTWRPGRVLVSVQIGLSVLLLIVAGLLLRSFANLSSIDLGFPRDGLLYVPLKSEGTLNPTGMPEYYTTLIEQTNAIAGVRSASLIHLLPLYRYHRKETFSLRGREYRLAAYINRASPDFFQTLGVPIKEGRNFGSSDRDIAPKVAVINESMAKAFFPSGDAVGKFIGLHPDPEGNQAQIIGVVADTVYRDVREQGAYAIYLSCFQEPRSWHSLGLLVRTLGDTRRIEGPVGDLIGALGRHQPSYARAYATTFNAWMGSVNLEEELVAVLSSFFSFSALGLAAMGLYALMAYTVTHRTYEIGVRIALGAKRADVQRLILGEALLLTTIGVTLGVFGALAASRIVGRMLFGLAPTDPSTLLSAVAVIFLVSMVAAIIPAVKATRLDPVEALRYE